MARSKVVPTTLTALEDQLRTDGFKGTQRAMRLLRSLRDALTGDGYAFTTEAPKRESAVVADTSNKKRGRPRKVVATIATAPAPKKRGRPRKASVDATLAALTAKVPVEVPNLDIDVESPAF